MSFGINFASTPPGRASSLAMYGATARNYGQVATNYDLSRPDYPNEALFKEWLDLLGITPETRVVDLGAGTGKLTKAILKTVYDTELPESVTTDKLIAVEMVADMRAHFKTAFPHIPVEGGFAEEIPLKDKSVDVVVVGTAFHWFDGPKALAEIARVLTRNGRLGLIWNMLDPEISWVRQLRELLEKNKQPNNHDTGEWKKAFYNTILFSSPFDQHTTHRYYKPANAAQIVDCLLSFKAAAEMSKEQKLAFRQEAEKILATHPDTKGKTEIQVPFRTEMYVCQKRAKPLKGSFQFDMERQDNTTVIKIAKAMSQINLSQMTPPEDKEGTS